MLKFDLKDKIKIPINWDSVLKYSGIVVLTVFIIALVFKLRALIILAELLGAILIFSFIIIGLFSALNKFSSQPKDKTNKNE